MEKDQKRMIVRTARFCLEKANGQVIKAVTPVKVYRTTNIGTVIKEKTGDRSRRLSDVTMVPSLV
ncbi:MAG TPA: hypothetical protein DC042_15215 [Bacteroidales bacterium]|nr:hypothetical protein [Bacteroidales bacterium]